MGTKLNQARGVQRSRTAQAGAAAFIQQLEDMVKQRSTLYVTPSVRLAALLDPKNVRRQADGKGQLLFVEFKDQIIKVSSNGCCKGHTGNVMF